jgi:glycosyltransferase involved in cell wall biosynthesis
MLLIPFLIRMIAEAKKRGPRPTIVAGNIYPAIVASLLSFFLPLQFEVYCYGTELLPLTRSNPLRRLFWSIALRRAATVYYLTGATRTLCELSGRREGYVRNVPRITLPDVSISRLADPERLLELLSIGRLVPHKGHLVLIEALSGITGGLPSWHCTIAGDGPEAGTIGTLIKNSSLGAAISLKTGLSDERLAAHYRTADIFVHPALSLATGIEGFGIVLLEAMAYGAAIIASRTGGITEVVDNNPAIALLVEPGDVNALRQAIIELLINKEKRRSMALAARAFVEERYAWK